MNKSIREKEKERKKKTNKNLYKEYEMKQKIIFI